MNKKKVCKYCGEEISKNNSVCPKCGKKQKMPVWLIVLIVVLVLGILSSISSSNSDSTDTETDSAESQAIETEDVDYDVDTSNESNYEDNSSNITISQKNAVDKAKSYLRVMAFSHDGLVAQLEYEQFSHEDAVYGADNCGADWNEQAAKKAKSYLDTMSFSRDGLIDQLEYEKFTHDQAVYGVEANGF